jgi:succinyl-diaminopimelate desuccinylase
MNSSSLLGAISTDQESHISLLQSFIRAPSPNPPGDTRLAAKVLQSYLESQSIPTSIIAPDPTKPNLVSDFVCGDPNGPRLVLNGHIDVFPVGNSDGWERDPWSGDIIEGSNGGKKVHGRGGVDMKAGTAASVIAFAYLFKHKEHLRGSVALCCVSDEETGGKLGSRFLLDEGERWRGDCMIDAEPGGLNTIRFAEKGTLRCSFEVKTEGAHGAYVHRSKGAICIAAALIEELAVVEDIVPDLDEGLVEYLQQEEVRAAVDEAMGKGAVEYIFKCTLNVGVINGGLKVNMIPGHCVFETDIRLPVGLDKKEVLTVVRKILERYPEVTMTVQEAASNPSSVCSHEHPMVGILARNAERVMGKGKKPVAIPSLGATDCKFWRYKKVPAYVFGVSPESMAARNESVSVDEFLTVVKTHALAAWEYLEGKCDQ